MFFGIYILLAWDCSFRLASYYIYIYIYICNIDIPTNYESLWGSILALITICYKVVLFYLTVLCTTVILPSFTRNPLALWVTYCDGLPDDHHRDNSLQWVSNGYNEYTEHSHRDNAITVGRWLGQQTSFLGNERELIFRSVKWTEGPLHSNGRGYKSPASTRNESVSHGPPRRALVI
jgi:hypothetical protein